jgi:polysaccharide deacetylase family sporulation protein PdaB
MASKIKLFIVILLCFLIIGCSSEQKQVSLEQSKKENSSASAIPAAKGIDKDNNTPELAGGAESVKRTVKHNQPIPEVVYYSGSTSSKEIALTFDDGPDTNYTVQILDILKQYSIKATFFVVGTRAQAHPDIIKRIVKEGHVIGNHTWDHSDLSKATSEQIELEVNKTEQVLDSISGLHTNIFRPPYGSASRTVINKIASMGYYIIDWSVDTRDWAGTSPPKIMAYVKKETRPGGIILQHCAGGKGDNLSNTIKVLPNIIQTLKAQNYDFVTIPQLLHLQSP